MCGVVLPHAASGFLDLRCVVVWGSFYDSKAGHMYNLLNVDPSALDLKVEIHLP